MLQIFLVVAAAVGLLLMQGGNCQCYMDTVCAGDTIDVTEAGLPIADQADCCVGTNAGLSYKDGSLCYLCIVHGFAQAAYDVVEDQRLDTMFQLNVKGTTQFGGALVATGVITATADGTAVDSDFERLTPIRVTNNAVIRLFAANDFIALEYDDRVLLTFAPDNPYLITDLLANGEYIRDSATVKIIDNDLLEINFLESDYLIVEGSAELSSPITIQLRQNQNPFTLMLSPVTIDTAESKGLSVFIDSETILPTSRATAVADFSDSATTITVPANSNPSYEISQFFTINDDDIDEDEQSFAIVAEIGPDVPENISCFQTEVGSDVCFGRRGATEIRITDNDPMIIGFTQRIRTVSEGQVPGVDLFQLQINVESARTAEREHPMEFRLQETSTNATVETLIPSSDDYDATFGLRANPDDPLEETRDLDPGTRTVVPLLTAIRNDLIPEDLECYSVRIIPVNVPGRRELFECSKDSAMAANYFCEHTICILDELFQVAFVRTMYTVDESVGPVLVCVNLTRPEFDVLDETVNVFVTDFTTSMYIPVGDVPFATPDIPDILGRYPMAERSDFQQQTPAVNLIDNILISELMRIVCYNQTIYDDLRLEANEYAGLTLGVEDNAQTTVLTLVKELFDQASILIVDNDRAVVGLEQTFFSVSEDVGYVELCANVSFPEITCPIEFPFEVGLWTADGTAVETMDYGVINETLMFDACETRKCVNVTITDDLVDEQKELFTYTLTRTPSLDPRIELDPIDGTVEIIDSDVVGLAVTSYTISESDEVVEVCINAVGTTSSCPSTESFHVTLSTSDQTAESPADYVAVDQVLTFAACESQRCVNVSLANDLVSEPEETFSLSLTRSTRSHISFTSATGVVVITDDDDRPAEVSFLPVNGTGVRISWSGSVHLPTSIHYTVSLSTTDIIISQYDRVYPRGTTSDVFVLDDDITLTNAYVHNFTLYYIIGNDVTFVRGPPTNVPFAFDKTSFQIQFGPFQYCMDWGLKKIARIIEKELQAYLIQIIREACSDCYKLTPSFLRPGLFLCHSNPTKTTYRSTLVNPFPTTNSTHLVGIIQSWVSTGPSLILDGLLVRVSPSCPTSISSLDEEECETGTTNDPQLGDRITQTLNFCAVRNLGEQVCRLGGC